MAKSDSSRAAAVSRALRAGGLMPLPSGTARGREGIRVTAGVLSTTSVIVSIDAPGARARLADSVSEVLVAAGYAVEETGREEGFYGHVMYRVARQAPSVSQ